MAVAVRAPDGRIIVHQEPLRAAVYRYPLMKLPVLRGLVALWDALGLGMKALLFSADVANWRGEQGVEGRYEVAREPVSADIPSTTATAAVPARTAPAITTITADVTTTPATTHTTTALPFIPADSSPATSVRYGSGAASAQVGAFAVSPHGNSTRDAGMVGLAAGVGVAMVVGIFFVLPALAAGLLAGPTGRRFGVAPDLIEGAIRLGLFVGYIWLIGYLPDVRRLFAYHGAEHKVINAYEAGAPLAPEVVQGFSIVNPRCGTTFLLLVLLLATLVFIFMGGLPVWAAVLLRVLLVPVVAVVAYEFIRFVAGLYHLPMVRALLLPGLALQKMTTRPPDLSMIEVAATALQVVLAADRKPESK